MLRWAAKLWPFDSIVISVAAKAVQFLWIPFSDTNLLWHLMSVGIFRVSSFVWKGVDGIWMQGDSISCRK